CNHVEMGHITGLLQKIKPAIEKTNHDEGNSSKEAYVDKVAYANVLSSMDEVLERSSIIRSLYHEGKIGIVGGMYSLENGKVHFIKHMFAETAESPSQQKLAV